MIQRLMIRRPGRFSLAVLLLFSLTAGAQLVRFAEPAPAIAEAQTPEAAGRSGVHIPRKTRVDLTRQMTDGEGFLWDIQHQGRIGQGTNYVYGNGLYLRVNGRNAPSSGDAWQDEDSDEIELGPQNVNGVNVSRRVRVYQDRGLARWLDIYENTTTGKVPVQANVQTYLNSHVSQTVTSSGGEAFGAKDWAFVTASQGGGNRPELLHIVCDERAKLRPAVQINNNQINVTYRFTLDPGQTAVICYFEAQGHSIAKLTKAMKEFRAYHALKDLPHSVRKLILNFSAGGGFPGIEFQRSERSDTIVQQSGDPIYGSIVNERYTVEAAYGRISVPAERVVGMVFDPIRRDRVRMALVDGQVVAGRLAAESIRMKLPTGGAVLEVPPDRIAQWSYRITPARPVDESPSGAMMLLRTGDRLRFDPGDVALSLRTRYGTAPLDGDALLSIRMDNRNNAVHTVRFINGSVLGGLLAPEVLRVPLALGPELTAPREMIAQMVFARETVEDPSLSLLELTDEARLHGRVADEQISLETEYGTVALEPASVKSIVMSDAHGEWASMTIWDGSVLHGRLAMATLRFHVEPGPELEIYCGQIASLTRSQTAPPAEVRKKVNELIGQLGAENYRDRQAATDELLKMGEPIVPLLRERLDVNDPEIRHRITDVIETLGGEPEPLGGGESPDAKFRVAPIR